MLKNNNMIRDKEIWSKTPSEKAALKEAKHKNKTILTSNWCGSNKNYSIPLYDKVIIYDKKHISKNIRKIHGNKY